MRGGIRTMKVCSTLDSGSFLYKQPPLPSTLYVKRKDRHKENDQKSS